MEIKTLLSISRPNFSDGQEWIRIAVTDDSSNIRFLEIEIGLAEFTKCLTGQSYVNCKGTINNLESVGKQKVREKRSIVLPMVTYDRIFAEEWLKENAQEEGWTLDSYLGSQSSMGTAENGNTILNYSVAKYV